MSSKAAKTPTKTSTAKTVSKRDTVASLAKNLKALETRLKGADTKNRKAITALESVVTDLRDSTRQSGITQKAALTRGLNQLEIRMETYLQRAAAQARADVRSELAAVTNAGANVSTLEAAVSAAHQRLDAMDNLQRESLARLNRHIADLATSVEKRLSSESKARQAAYAALDAKIDTVRDTVEKRVDQVETDTANALKIVGAKVTEFAAVLEKRAQSSDAETAERLADLAHDTKSEFNTSQNDMTARIEALEVIASAWSPAEPQAPEIANPYLPANADDPRIDQMDETIRALQDELASMQARIAARPAAEPTARSNSEKPATAPTNIVPMPIPSHPAANSQQQDNPYAAAAQALGASAAQTSAPSAKAAAQPPAARRADRKRKDSHIPQEFDPTAYAPRAETQQPPISAINPPPLGPPPVAPSSMAPQPPVAPPPPVAAPPMASAGTYAPRSSLAELETPSDVPGLDLHNSEPVMAAPQPISTYADPAYGEDNEMRAERIGGERPKRKSSLPKIPLSGRNLRVGALAAGVAVTGLFAAKIILGGPNSDGVEMAASETQNISPGSQSGESQSGGFSAQNAGFSEAVGSPPPPSEPVGQYAETQTPTFVKGQEDTLDAAVANGNPIAQFQKGLAQLQLGQMEDGARLIRLSANRNQPAAQYRLAKLYETGTGVAKDPITARELIERAAQGGNRIAMHDLGNYHAYGQGGLTSDMDEALKWFTKAAERGVVDSQFNVAFLREGNESVAADIDTALFWYHVAARQGDQGANARRHQIL